MYFLNGKNYLKNMTRIKPKDGNKTFCMAPWTHTYLSPQMERRLCCSSRETPEKRRKSTFSGQLTPVRDTIEARHEEYL